jgi:hypothetical protein
LPDQMNWAHIALWGGQTVLILTLLLYALIKLAPSWKDVRLRELGVREAEANAKIEDARAKGEQASAMLQVANVLNNVAVEQRRATETIEILQRLNADSADRLDHVVRALNDRSTKLEERLAEIGQGVGGFQRGIAERLEVLEKANVQS